MLIKFENPVNKINSIVNLAYVVEIYSVGRSVMLTYHTGEFDTELNTDAKTICIAEYEDAEICASVLKDFYYNVLHDVKIYDFTIAPDALWDYSF